MLGELKSGMRSRFSTPDAVFAGEAAADLDAEPEDVGTEGSSARFRKLAAGGWRRT